MPNSHNLDRYARQMRYMPLGEAGQRRLAHSRAMVCGCGATGSLMANMLVRAGVGSVRIVDGDRVDATNLHRQMLFDEDDAAGEAPKATAAAAKLRRINSQVNVEPIVARLDRANIEELCRGVDVIVDGTDNFATRFIINATSVKLGIPWIYGGCSGAEGQTMTILPRETACLRCLMPDDTAETTSAGIIAPIVGVIASIEVVEAIKILSGNRDAVSRYLTIVDLWKNRIRQVDVSKLRDQADCPTCR